MKLVLASNSGFLYEEGYKLLGIPFSEIRLGYVTTAGNLRENKSYIENHKNEMKKLGIDFYEFDIKDKTIDELRSFFQDKNVIHVVGGDTCYLLLEARKSNFKIFLDEFFQRGGMYVGTSAGSYIMGANIETTFWKDKNKETYGLTDFAGLHFVPYMFFAHYTDEMREKIKEKVDHSKYPVKILRDGQALFCDSGKCVFVGKDKEVII